MSAIKTGENGTYLVLEPTLSNLIISNLARIINEVLAIGEQPIVVCAPILRFYFKQLTQSTIPDLVVLSFNELESDIEIQTLKVVSLK